MKRAIPIIFIFFLLALTGCQIKQYTPDVTSDFSQSAFVTTGDFSYECEISRKNGVYSLLATSTSAKGFSMTYDGSMMSYSYQGMEYEALGSDLEKNNPVIAIYDVFNYITGTDPIAAKKTDNGFRFDGKTALGKFILYQSDDGSYESIHFLTADLLIEFGKESGMSSKL